MLNKILKAASLAGSKQTYITTVSDLEPLSNHILRVRLATEAQANFPPGFEGGYVKLVLEDSHRSDYMRSYTVRAFCPTTHTLTLDMVVHEHDGPAARWIANAGVGTQLKVRGPGACASINTDADWFLLAGDLSALPAIAVNLEKLPDTAKGFAIIEVPSEADIVKLESPAELDIRWLVNPPGDDDPLRLLDTVRDLPWQQGKAAVWAAGEFDNVKGLRRYISKDNGVPKSHSYISCYWKRGVGNEGMKAAKRKDREMW